MYSTETLKKHEWSKTVKFEGCYTANVIFRNLEACGCEPVATVATKWRPHRCNDAVAASRRCCNRRNKWWPHHRNGIKLQLHGF